MFYRPASPVVLAGSVAAFSSEEGGQQGDPGFCSDYSLTTHATAVAVDAELAAVGGFARFQVDDGTLYGPPDAVFKALRRYSVAVAADGENLRFDKCSAWMPGDDDGTALAADPAYLADCDGRPSSEIVRVVTDAGITINGIPFGAASYRVSHSDSDFFQELRE